VARQIHHADALDWLSAHPAHPGASLVTSLPDVAELGRSEAHWRGVFTEAARSCLEAVPPAGIAVFVQTDNKRTAGWVSKAGLVMAAAEALGVPLLWHKLVLRRAPGAVVRGRPGYSHLLAFSREARVPRERGGTDVLPDPGHRPWTHSIGTRPARFAVETIQAHSPQTTVLLNPFCGEGTVVAVAEALGLDCIGIERKRKRARRARVLRYLADEDRCVGGERPGLSPQREGSGSGGAGR
jgi:hypothetical protein